MEKIKAWAIFGPDRKLHLWTINKARERAIGIFMGCSNSYQSWETAKRAGHTCRRVTVREVTNA